MASQTVNERKETRRSVASFDIVGFTFTVFISNDSVVGMLSWVSSGPWPMPAVYIIIFILSCRCRLEEKSGRKVDPRRLS